MPTNGVVRIPIPGVDVVRPERRGWGWLVSLGTFRGRGDTLVDASSDLARQIVAAVEASATSPAFGLAPDGTVVAALDRPWGIDSYRVATFGQRLMATVPHHDPVRAIADVPGIELVPRR